MPLLGRLLTTLLVVLLAVTGLALTAWYLAYETGPSLDGEVRVPGLGASVTVTHDADGLATVEAQSEADLMAGLGYAHALHNAWPMALRRQAATGSLSQWFDDEATLAFDRHALQLGFGALARTLYDALPEADRTVLGAYARGVNRAFERDRLSEGDEFVLLDVDARRWEPWDALAVERLVAYLAASASTLADSLAQDAYRASPSLGRFVAADSAFRATLRVGGLEHSLAFAVQNSAGTQFVQRHVYGRSALPLLQEVALRQGGRQTVVASVPGTLVFPAGYGDRTAWSLFLNGTTDLVSAPTDSAALVPSYDRITARSGDETLVTVYRSPDALHLFAPNETAPAPVVQDSASAPPVLSTWQLRWRGFGTATDLGAWRALLRGEAATFALFPGTGLIAEDGQARVLGSPAVARSLPGGVVAGSSDEARYVADRLALLAAGSTDTGPDGLLADAYSAWAAALAPPLIAALDGPGEIDADLRDAAAYLRGWDFRYDPASIGASVFETWMATHRARTGTLPDPAAVSAPPPPPDSTGRVMPNPAAVALTQSLRQAVAAIDSAYGSDGARWRWQNVQQAVRLYPLFTTDTTDAGRRRFAPILLPDGGHPTALAWGPSPALAWGPSPALAGTEPSAVWSAQATVPGAADLRIRHRNPNADDARTRSLASARPLQPRPVGQAPETVHTLRLLPAEE
ncbi:MAG: penicillin acylase family protein [Bacteroidota bacterium]